MITITKLHIPQARSALVQRQRLFHRLNDGLDGNLTFITAPAGYGKTTLLSEWSRTIKPPVAWVSLDAGDNERMRFWSHTVAALKQACPEIGEQKVLSFAAADASGASLIAALINELDRLSQPIVLVWDDLHHIEEEATRHGIEYLLEIPDAVLFTKPMMWITRIVSLFLSGQIELANTKLSWVKERFAETVSSFPEKTIEPFQAGLCVLEAFGACFERDFEASIRHFEAYMQRNPSGDFFVGLGTDDALCSHNAKRRNHWKQVSRRFGRAKLWESESFFSIGSCNRKKWSRRLGRL